MKRDVKLVVRGVFAVSVVCMCGAWCENLDETKAFLLAAVARVESGNHE